MKMRKYLIVGGSLFKNSAGHSMFTGLKLLGSAESEDKAQEIVDSNYNDCGGLILVINTHTGQEVHTSL